MLAYSETAYEEPGQHRPMGSVASGGEFYGGNASHWADQKQPSFPRLTYSYNNNWGTAAICMGVSEEAIINATGGVKVPL